MNIGEVIRRHRKAKGMTQEEMAGCLGVTTPAVNKWENGNTMPDITLLAPISRLLDVSLNELLSFHEELTEQEIRDLTDRLSRKLETEDFDAVYAWAKKQVDEYPNCEALIHSFAVMLYAACRMKELPKDKRCDDFILFCYERLLKSDDEKMRLAGASSLFNYYFAEEQYEKAEGCLAYLSDQNPDKKRKQARLYEKTGETDKAFKAYEEILFSENQIISDVLRSLFLMEMKRGDVEKCRFYVEKERALVRLFDMGEYNAYSAELELVMMEKDADKTIACVRGMLENVDTLFAFTASPLYAHLTFKEAEPDFEQTLKKSLLDGFREDDSFAYVKDDPRWKALVSEEE